MLKTPSYAQTGRLMQIFISDNMDANDPARIALLKKWINRLTISKTNGFNAIRTFIAPSELGTAAAFKEIFRLCAVSGIELVADSVNTAFQSLKRADYAAYIDTLGYVENVRAFAIDDAQRFTSLEIEAMAKPLYRHAGAIFVSTGVSAGEEDIARISRVCSQLSLTFELQAYRQGESTALPGEWLETYNVGCLAFETYKTSAKGKTTSVSDITNMGKGILAQEILPRYMSVYAGKDEYTDLLTRANAERLKALDTFAAQVWERWGV